MKVNEIDHIRVAVRDLEQARKAWEPVLGKRAHPKALNGVLLELIDHEWKEPEKK